MGPEARRAAAGMPPLPSTVDPNPSGPIKGFRFVAGEMRDPRTGQTFPVSVFPSPEDPGGAPENWTNNPNEGDPLAQIVITTVVLGPIGRAAIAALEPTIGVAAIPLVGAGEGALAAKSTGGDPETGAAFGFFFGILGAIARARPPAPRELPAGEQPAGLLPPAGETTQTLQQVQRARGTNYQRGQGFNQYLAQRRGGAKEGPGTGVQTKLGLRKHDVVDVPAAPRTQMAIEGKLYLEFRTVSSRVVKGEVPLTPEIRTQIHKDVLWIREGQKQGITRIVQWEFGAAPPSPALLDLLKHWELPIVFHNP